MGEGIVVVGCCGSGAFDVFLFLRQVTVVLRCDDGVDHVFACSFLYSVMAFLIHSSHTYETHHK